MGNISGETTTTKLLDAWKVRKSITSDNAAGLELGAKRQTISTWRTLKGHASPAFAARMAKDLGLDELAVLAAIEADRAQGDDRRVWQRHGRAAFMALILGGSMSLLSPGLQARQLAFPVSLTPQNPPLCEI